ncbi:hypothetical protein [Defluviimonas salinarum]|uniref:Uncharacterized protein n=1 Tax=Defluviimonas salinarum TaxID=2992147 RepID=A0ABT3J500_9RHOB|nr:hypothetical protein [Defluviimonas salinarum]MCW3782484.1 hypothetical protein [Defluviimonas salinarum]
MKYDTEAMNTAACLWEQCIEPTHALFRGVQALRDIHGTVDVRAGIVGLSEACDIVYETARGLGYDDSFDWEFCPLFLRHCTTADDPEATDIALKFNLADEAAVKANAQLILDHAWKPSDSSPSL